MANSGAVNREVDGLPTTVRGSHDCAAGAVLLESRFAIGLLGVCVARVVGILLVVPLLLVEPAHGDDAIPRHVAQQGDDEGDCTLPVRPCRTIGYALSVAGKGDQVRVAGGAYQLGDVLDTLQLVNSAVDVRGGYNRFDHFLLQDTAANPTTLTGVPVALRDQLQDRGFHVIVDRKGLDPVGRAAIADYRATQRSSSSATCTDSTADGYPCDDVDLLSHLALGDLSTVPYNAADVWGFVDLNTEREYALLGLVDGLAVIDVTDPGTPFEVGTVGGATSGWRDVKVTQRFDHDAHRWRTHAYVSTEIGGRLVVLDLTELPNRVRLGRRSDTSAHNVYVSNVDYATGVSLDVDGAPPLLQVLGSFNNQGAFRTFDLRDPDNLFEVALSVGGYSHDATSMVVTDARASSCKAATETCEVLLDFNEDTIDIWDFSKQDAPELLSSTTYPNAGYVHSGWWTEDGRYLFVHDEFDERQANLDTTVRIFDLEDLEDPVHVETWTGPSPAVDHNGYVRGNRYYMSNYTRGVTVLDITDPREPEDIGYFDTHPASDSNYFGGAWGVYPFLPSGNLLVSDIGGGLFVLADRTRTSDHGKLGFSSTTFGGEEGGEATVSVTREEGMSGVVSVDYTVFAGSADSSDFTVSTGTLHWSDGDGDERGIAIPLLADGFDEPIERAFVRLGNPVGGAVLDDASLASVFIGDPGGTASLGFAEPRIAVDERAGRVVATVNRRGSPLGAVSVEYEIQAITATEDSDYVVPASGALSWEDGDATARTIVIALVQDDVEETGEQFEVRLSSASGAMLGDDDSLMVEINAEGMAVTRFMLFDSRIKQDLLEIRDGDVLHPREFPATTGLRAVVNDPDGVASVGLAFNGDSSVDTANDAPYLFRTGEAYPVGEYQLTATPYSADDLAGTTGESLTVTFSVTDDLARWWEDATLSALALSGVDIDFASGTDSYRVVVDAGFTSTTVTATPTREGASHVVTPDDADSALTGHQVAIDGPVIITVAVTARDGETSRRYTVNVRHAADGEAFGVSITSTATGPVAGAFDVAITFARTVTGFVSDDIVVTNGTVTAFAGSGSAYTATITPTEGATGKITVAVPGGVAFDADDIANSAATPFELELASAASMDATLTALSLSGIELDFDSGTTAYGALIGWEVARTTVSATAASGAGFVVSPEDDDTIVEGHQVDLEPGLNVIRVTVTAEDGETTKSYWVLVVRGGFGLGS